VTSSVTRQFDSPYAISFSGPFGTKPLPLAVSELFNGKCDAMADMTLLVPIDSLYMTSYRLFIVTSAQGCIV